MNSFQIIAIALLGLLVSMLVTSQAQAMAVAAVYFLGMLLFGNFLYPVEQSSTAITVLSKLFPLTFLRPLIQDWMLGVPPGAPTRWMTGQLWMQCAAVAVLAVPSVIRALRRV